MSTVELGAIISPWYVDGGGYLLTPSGVRVARLDVYGTMWLWDKRAHNEVPFTLDDWQICQSQMRSESHEPDIH